MECVCPRPAALKTVIRMTCVENVDQIQMLGFQRIGHNFDANAGVPNPITALASWTPLLTAVDGTKVVLTPRTDSFNIPRAEAITRGGNDNTTQNGVEQLLGYGGITVTGLFTSVPIPIITQIRDLSCEPSLGFYGYNRYGKIMCREMDPVANPGDVYSVIPIEPNTFGCSYPDVKGFGTVDEAELRFGLAEDWALNRALVTPAFDWKTQLLAPLA